MPITLNHSNISVQYSSDKSYIIETVKSDLYLKNDNYDNIVRDNLQTAPVTPSIYIENGTNNVYAVESYTYSGSANTADFTRVFTKSTTCDILIVGGGGGGGCGMGGGGGGGQVVHSSNVNIPTGTYNIIVGSGGAGAVSKNGTNGANSVAFGATANGGGGGGGTGTWGTATAVGLAGGSGGGGGANSTNTLQSGGTVSFGTLGSILASAIRYGNAGGTGKYDTSYGGGGGGGGAGSAGTAGNSISKGNGGNGVIINITGTSYYWAGGGGGAGWGSSSGGGGGNGGLGGGGGGAFGAGADTPGINGLGGINNNIIQPLSTTGAAGANNTGSGGGAGTYNANAGGAGGSGIVIIRYLLGTIPTTNLLTTEPSITPATTFTETVRSFIHSGGAEAQTTYTITVGRDTICDILIVGGGGGGGKTDAGGGGAGGLIYIQNITLFGNYTIQVGKKGLGGKSASTISLIGEKGGNSSIIGANANYIAYGGGGGGYGHPSDVEPGNLGPYGSSGGLGTSDQTRESFNINTPGQGHLGGLGTAVEGGGGGGGSGGPGVNSGNGGIGTQINITGTNLYYAGGGGGGHNPSGTSGGLGGGGSATYYIGNNATFYGGGGGGGGASWGDGGDGFDGIVIIKFKSLVGPILEGTTHKRLNFAYNNDNLVAWYRFNNDYLDSSGNGHNLTNVGTVIQSTQVIEGQAVEFDSTDYLEFPATINPYSIWNNGKGITFSFWVRFTSITGTYSRFIDFQSGASSVSGIMFAFRGSSEAFYLNCGGSTTFSYSNLSNNIITTLGVWHHIVWSIDITGKWDVYLNNVRINNTETSAIANITYNLRYINKSVYTGNGVWGGQMDDFRIYDRALSAADVASLYNKTYPAPSNTYTVNFQVPTIADINNNSNIVLRGAYDIALTTTNAVITPKTGQYIPKPTTFTNYAVERMYPPVRNFTAATTIVSGQTYGNGTYVVSFSSTVGSSVDPWTCFNTGATTGGHWADSRYTAGVFNNTSFIVAGYLGDWVKIQLPVAIKLTRFNFVSRPTYQVRSPKDFKIYGSNDNITWVELVNKTDALYNASNIYEQTTPEITNTYTYYGLVVNKIFSTGTVLNFDEWYIYGQEVLPSSLSLRYHLLNPTLDPIGAQWTYSSNNTNVYHMGSVGIGTTSPEYQLDVRGAIYSSVGGYTQTGLTTWSITSDRRIKENITRASYDICLENVKNIELYNFNFKNNCVNTNDKHQLGFIAQEVQQVYPKAVEVGKMILNTNEAIDDILTLNTTQIDYTLYGAVKNLIEKIEDIDNDLESIEKLI
jgi:hypothetical protein